MRPALGYASQADTVGTVVEGLRPNLLVGHWLKQWQKEAYKMEEGWEGEEREGREELC